VRKARLSDEAGSGGQDAGGVRAVDFKAHSIYCRAEALNAFRDDPPRRKILNEESEFLSTGERLTSVLKILEREPVLLSLLLGVLATPFSMRDDAGIWTSAESEPQEIGLLEYYVSPVA
jgi:hypothetical protein